MALRRKSVRGLRRFRRRPTSQSHARRLARLRRSTTHTYYQRHTIRQSQQNKDQSLRETRCFSTRRIGKLERSRNRTCGPSSNARTVGCSTDRLPVEERIACGASRVRWPYKRNPLTVTIRDTTNGNAADRSHILTLSLPHAGLARKLPAIMTAAMAVQKHPIAAGTPFNSQWPTNGSTGFRYLDPYS